MSQDLHNWTLLSELTTLQNSFIARINVSIYMMVAKSYVITYTREYMGFLSDNTEYILGAPNEKNIEKRLKRSFLLLSLIVLWSFKGTLVRANTN